MDRRPEYVTVKLMEWQPVGDQQFLFRITEEAKDDIELAASRLGFTASHFARVILIQAARKILAEMGTQP